MNVERSQVARRFRPDHRIPISNDRLLDIDDGQALFRFKDYRAGAAPASCP
jgi:hypothetical protein